MRKEQVILRFVKINKILKCARCFIDTGSIDIVESFPDIIHIGDWAEEIEAHWEVSKDDYTPIELSKVYVTDKYYKASQMPNMISVAQKLLTIENAPKEVTNSLSKFVAIMTVLKANIENYQRKHQGKLFGVPKELQNEDTLRLLDHCTQNNILNDHYQPTEGIKPFQLKLIAYAISTTTGKKPSWSAFEKLWSLGYNLKGVTVPVTKPGEINKVLRLFPGTNIPTKQQKDLVFICGRSNKELQQIFIHLQESGYISNMAAERDWMVICGKAELDNEIKPIPWIAELRHLVILVNKLFASCNNEKIWVKTISCFEINGRTPNIGSLKAANTWLSKNSNYDPNLETIIDNSYENKGVY